MTWSWLSSCSRRSTSSSSSILSIAITPSSSHRPQCRYLGLQRGVWVLLPLPALPPCLGQGGDGWGGGGLHGSSHLLVAPTGPGAAAWGAEAAAEARLGLCHPIAPVGAPQGLVGGSPTSTDPQLWVLQGEDLRPEAGTWRKGGSFPPTAGTTQIFPVALTRGGSPRRGGHLWGGHTRTPPRV